MVLAARRARQAARMVETLFVLLAAPFVSAGLIYLLLLMADAIISAAADFVGK